MCESCFPLSILKVVSTKQYRYIPHKERKSIHFRQHLSNKICKGCILLGQSPGYSFLLFDATQLESAKCTEEEKKMLGKRKLLKVQNESQQKKA